MNNEWKYPNTITGDAATGDKFFKRERIVEQFWREVRKGNHILFVAPRRVGKTSVMKDIEENPIDGYRCIYQNIESVNSKNGFYKRLFELFLQCVNRSAKAKGLVAKWVKKFNISEITLTGIKIGKSDIDYKEELRQLIAELNDVDEHIVIFLDEFAEVINTLAKKDLQNDAIDILHTLREMRSDANCNKLTLVFAGSIGLEYVVKSIERPKLINDLFRITTIPLTKEEGLLLINQLTKDATINFSEEVSVYLLEKLNHLLPYYIQLMIEEIDVIAKKDNAPEITKEVIDAAFDNVIKNNKNFDDWLERLKDYQKNVFPFINEILIKCAFNNQITVQEIFNIALAEKHQLGDDYMNYIEQLITEGYLVESSKHQYRFISPFLQKFWKNKYPVYNG